MWPAHDGYVLKAHEHGTLRRQTGTPVGIFGVSDDQWGLSFSKIMEDIVVDENPDRGAARSNPQRDEEAATLTNPSPIAEDRRTRFLLKVISHSGLNSGRFV